MYGIDGGVGEEAGGAGSLEYAQEGQPEQSHPLASRVSHEYDATQRSQVFPLHVAGQLPSTAGASGGEGVGAGASCGEGVGAGSLDALKHTKRRIDILIRSGPRILCMQASDPQPGDGKLKA